tara:strand:- start:684 stop:866 length:183 start_codon:yes stop_codon:yes gene_type:complete
MNDILKSKRFWATVSGIAVVVANQFFPSISSDAVVAIIASISVWIVGDSLRATTEKKNVA